MSTTDHATATPAANQKRSLLFPGIVFALLGMNITIVVITAVAAHRSEPRGERDLRVLESAATKPAAPADRFTNPPAPAK